MPGPVFLDGEQVALRTVEESDLPFHQEAINDARIWRPTGRPLPVNRRRLRDRFESAVSDEDSVWLLVTVDATRVGIVALKTIEWRSRSARLGYWIHPDHQRQGYGSEAVELLVGHGFEQLGLHRLVARTFETNDASRRLVESLGFTREGVEREAAFVDGEHRDVLRYALLAHEWTGTGRTDE